MSVFCIPGEPCIMFCGETDNFVVIQVAALTLLALLLVLEARCTHFVIAHFNY